MKVLLSIICFTISSLAAPLPGIKKAKRNSKLNLLLDSIDEVEIEEDFFPSIPLRKDPSYVALAAASEFFNSLNTSRRAEERKSISYVHQSKPNRWTAETSSPIATPNSARNAVPPRSSKTRWDSNGDSGPDICENIGSAYSINAARPVMRTDDSNGKIVSSICLANSKDKAGELGSKSPRRPRIIRKHQPR
jgi:hypothetical protein